GGSPPLESPAWEETCPEFLRILPAVRYKKNVSASTNRNMSPFKRPAGGVSLTTKPQIRCQNAIQGQRSFPTDKDRLDKIGDRGVPGGVLVTFSPWKK